MTTFPPSTLMADTMTPIRRHMALPRVAPRVPPESVS